MSTRNPVDAEHLSEVCQPNEPAGVSLSMDADHYADSHESGADPLVGYGQDVDLEAEEILGEITDNDQGPHWLQVCVWRQSNPAAEVWVHCQAERQPAAAVDVRVSGPKLPGSLGIGVVVERDRSGAGPFPRPRLLTARGRAPGARALAEARAEARTPAFVDLPPAEAAPQLGMSLDALYTWLRRHERRGRCKVGPDLMAYRRGRAWRIRFPVA